MSDKQTNLHPKNNSDINLKPNIIGDNIPEKSVAFNQLNQNVQNTITSINESVDKIHDTSKDFVELITTVECYRGQYYNGTQYVENANTCSFKNRLKLDKNSKYITNRLYQAFCFVSVDENGSDEIKATFDDKTLITDDKHVYLLATIESSNPSDARISQYDCLPGEYINFPFREYGDNIHRFYVGTGHFYHRLRDAIEEAVKFYGSEVYVESGVYNLVDEFANDLETSNGIYLKNAVKVYCEPNTIIKFIYTGTSANVHTYFSPFNSGEYGFELHGATIIAKNCRYCIHDERGNTLDAYQIVIDGCEMELDNTENPDWTNSQVIGGGLGYHGKIIIRDNIFGNYVTYHNFDGEVYVTDFKSVVTIANNYFKNGAVFVSSATHAGTEVTDYIVYGNSFASGIQQSLGTTEKLYLWNNEVRS